MGGIFLYLDLIIHLQEASVNSWKCVNIVKIVSFPVYPAINGADKPGGPPGGGPVEAAAWRPPLIGSLGSLRSPRSLGSRRLADARRLLPGGTARRPGGRRASGGCQAARSARCCSQTRPPLTSCTWQRSSWQPPALLQRREQPSTTRPTAAPVFIPLSRSVYLVCHFLSSYNFRKHMILDSHQNQLVRGYP